MLQYLKSNLSNGTTPIREWPHPLQATPTLERKIQLTSKLTTTTATLTGFEWRVGLTAFSQQPLLSSPSHSKRLQLVAEIAHTSLPPFLLSLPKTFL